MPVDEKALGGAILARGCAILPGAFLFIEYFIFTGNQWLIAPAAMIMAAVYQARGWDGRCLLAWGVVSLLLAVLSLGGSQWTANSLAIGGYWLCFAGIMRMGAELALARVDGRLGGPAGTGNATRTAPGHGGKRRPAGKSHGKGGGRLE